MEKSQLDTMAQEACERKMALDKLNRQGRLLFNTIAVSGKTIAIGERNLTQIH